MFCEYIVAPLIGWNLDGGMGFWINWEVIDHLEDWLGPVDEQKIGSDDETYEILIAYVHAQLSNGTPSRQHRNWGDFGGPSEYNTLFTPEDKAFIREVLGHNPPEILGVSRTGRIEYAPVG